MSRISDLVKAYGEFISLPWQDGMAAYQRVIMCVYDEDDELKLRAVKAEFTLATTHAGHDWVEYDVTDLFSKWMMSNASVEKCFERPELFNSIIHTFKNYLINDFKKFIDNKTPEKNYVVALTGTGSLFGFIKVKSLVEGIANMVTGRLVVFFPGSYENNNYRLLDAYDGWNYLAVPITADSKK